ncbi:MAG TPA: molybdopterin-dependent oxidoreductase [Acidimicrobiia bacterium]|nr:molybdopterin-dependent oxidoreductase [Acidimicrobiia bacterium]
MTRTAYRTCPLCEATCGLEITVEEGGVKLIRGDRDNPFSGGFLCPKGTTLGRLHDDPDRIRTPLVKRGGAFVEVSWSEALAEIDRRLRAVFESHGRDAVALYVGNPNAHGFHNLLAIRPFAKALGTRNIYTADTVDQIPKHVACAYMFGHPAAIPVPDVDRTDFLLMLGANPLESNGSLATAPDWPGRLQALRDRGGELVVVDPRRTKTADMATRHIAIRPGTDAAWLTSLIHAIFEEELVSLEMVPVEGLDEVRRMVGGFAPEVTASFTDVAADVTREIARDLAAAPSACVYGRLGTHTVEYGTLAAWAVDVLNVITGNLDRPGGAMFPIGLHQPARRQSRPFRQGRFHSRVRNLPETMGELPVATLADEILTPGDGRVRALVTIAGNPVLTTPHAGRLDEALADLEFMVSVDLYVNETTRHADVVLPGRSALEKSHYDLSFTAFSLREYAMYSPAVFEHDGLSEFEAIVALTGIAAGMGPDIDPTTLSEAALVSQVQTAVSDPASPIHGRDPDEIMKELAPWPIPERFLDFMIRTGHRGDGFGSNPEGMTLQLLSESPHGIDFGALTPRFADAVTTPSGRVELAPEPILSDIPRLQEAVNRAPTDSIVLVGRRDLRSNNSWLHNVEVLVRGKERCTLHVHPDDARRIGIEDGDPVTVRSVVGELTATAEVTDTVRPGVVSLPYGWGHDADGSRLSVASARPGVNVNLLTDHTRIDPLSGNAVLNAIPVELAAAR